MVQIVGKYQYVSSENFENYIRSLDKGDLVDTFLQTMPIVEIQQNDDQWYIIVTISQDKTITVTFKLGEVYDEYVSSSQIIYKSVTTKEDNGFRTETPLSADFIGIRVYEFTDTEMIMYLSSNKSDVKAKRTYKRL
ncbi:hypothetical protein ALC60_09891 [Trachymyrmex zeteki]|uniref:Uncharacterized protein n=1 Tax=Mycetomoellerius zeteki TaxID=64791 RepID=A0A151WSW7_9HYME|nr:PREDICTED: fatty acid-binding protein homolog 9-like [Trachymyrmex zeteki]KYQ51012.1 hypothetical protein ALC60_09891 [Trachymyrmex zeteki]